MPSVNAPIPEPSPPHSHVDAERCQGCGEAYDAWHPGVSFADGCELVRNLADPCRQDCGGGGFRSRAPVLWAMRVLKLRAWYLRHSMCAPDAEMAGDMLVDGLTGRPLF